MSTKVKVRRVIEQQKNSSVPILVNFEHAQVNKQVDINTRLVGAVYESDSRNTVDQSNQPIRSQLVVVQGETDMTYLGSTEGPLNSPNGLRTFLAVRHKNKLKVYEARRITVSPYISNRAHLQVKDSKKIEDTDGKIQAVGDLVKAFGSKKKRLNFERQERNVIHSEHMNDSINLASETAVISTPIKSSSGTDFAVIPPRNSDTKERDNVYDLDDILTTDDLAGMENMAQGWLNCEQDQIEEWKASKRFSAYFFEMHQRLAPHKADVMTVHNAKLVLYTELLIALLKLKFTDLKSKKLPIPDEFDKWLVDKALSIFTLVNARKIRTRSEAYKDKTCCYIMVLVLLTNNFVFDVQLMSSSLQIHIKKLLTLTREVGITTTLNPSTKEYTGLLKFPLAKPVELRSPKKKQNFRK